MSAQTIRYEKGVITVPDNPVILFMEGDGTGPDIWRATRIALDAVVEKTYGGKRKIEWMEVLAGESLQETGRWPPRTRWKINRHKGGHQGPSPRLSEVDQKHQRDPAPEDDSMPASGRPGTRLESQAR